MSYLLKETKIVASCNIIKSTSFGVKTNIESSSNFAMDFIYSIICINGAFKKNIKFSTEFYSTELLFHNAFEQQIR